MLVLFFRCLLSVLEEDHTGRAVIVHSAPSGFPAGLALVGERGADKPPVVGTILDLPARGVVEKLFDAFDADLLGVNQFPDTAKPLYIVFGVQPVSALPRRENQAVLLVKPQGLGCGTHKLCGDPHGIKRCVLVF